MTNALWCVPMAALMPYIWSSLAKYTGAEFDNSRPREFLDQITGWRKRANWAQKNSFEALPLFTSGVIVAHYVGKATQLQIDIAAFIFIGLRAFYGLSYIKNWAAARSIAWFMGLMTSMSFFFMSI